MRQKQLICNTSPSEMKSKKKLKDMEKSVDPELWHACAGGLVQIPQVNNKIFYFPQGHAEHACEPVNFKELSNVPPFIPCRVAAVKYMADHETDEVYVKLILVPLHSNEVSFQDDGGECSTSASETKDKPQYFAKTLTQSDANNGGGFSCPKYCAVRFFPPLDLSTSPPMQDIFPKDIHGEKWQFKHIYRGTPKRHLLTTGWSQFVTQKKLVAGDSIVFMKAENGDICFGIRRAKREICDLLEAPSGYEPTTAIQEEDNNNNKVQRNSKGTALRISDGMMGKGKVSAQQVIEATTLATNMQPFEVVYYPRSNTPEFFVKTYVVGTAIQNRWYPGMRFQMTIETEDSSRISLFNGTIASFDPVDKTWPHSPWRCLQVTWDDTELLQNVKRVNPWQVKIVSDMSSTHLSPSTPPPRNKLILLPQPSFLLDYHISMPNFRNKFQSPISPFTQFPEISPADMQGARHSHFGLLHPKFQPFNPTATTSMTINNNSGLQKSSNDDNILCALSISSSIESSKEPEHVKQHQLVLFGKTITIEQQVPPSAIVEVGNENADKSTDESGNENVENSTNDFSDLRLQGLSERPFLERLEWNQYKDTKDVEKVMDLSEPTPKWLGG